MIEYNVRLETWTYLEEYRSGHNEAVLKTVCPQGHGGSNPSFSVVLKWREPSNIKGSRCFFEIPQKDLF